ncbi:TIGR03750 family conjugal transfer protein [Klebsiella quasipneumoniae]|uniref:TIGR03750 family conjugal transfer protein n=1 Tax=Klebsiella quasipneumoniae TaxID=1463165 RepID=UPI0022282DA6|nr:TIGR03750 family conjugal transfer protein [Klebsiella quasipneumoniae]
MSTIPFLPERLNREPAVFRGLTVSELLIALLVGMATHIKCNEMSLLLKKCIPNFYA